MYKWKITNWLAPSRKRGVCDKTLYNIFVSPLNFWLRYLGTSCIIIKKSLKINVKCYPENILRYNQGCKGEGKMLTLRCEEVKFPNIPDWFFFSLHNIIPKISLLIGITIFTTGIYNKNILLIYSQEHRSVINAFEPPGTQNVMTESFYIISYLFSWKYTRRYRPYRVFLMTRLRCPLSVWFIPWPWFMLWTWSHVSSCYLCVLRFGRLLCC